MSTNAVIGAAWSDKLAQEIDCSVTYRATVGTFDAIEGQRTGNTTATAGGKCMVDVRRYSDGSAERETGQAIIGLLPAGVELHCSDRLTVADRTYQITDLTPLRDESTTYVWLVSIEAVPA